MTLEQHEIEVKKLNKIEIELINIIHGLQNDALIDKFNEWQDQRTACVEGYFDFIENLDKA